MNKNNNLVCIDWGTSSLRAYLINKDGNILEERTFPWGVKQLPFNLATREDSFKETFKSICQDWISNKSVHVMICGMATSAMGWKETPYIPCPAVLNDVAEGMTTFEVDGTPVHLISGLVSNVKTPDVMRGEETQIFGTIDTKVLEDKLICLPGTHSKWAVIEQSEVVDFTTFMTGEVFDILCQHSILLDADNLAADFDEMAFMQGVKVNNNNDNLLSTIFSTRSLNLRGMIDNDQKHSYLSGLIIGNEINQVKKYIKEHAQHKHITLIGNGKLCQLYLNAINVLMPDININTDEYAAVTGMLNMANTKGLL
jgi:2-dehydro-3-deoxygalactonokinase